LPARCDSDLFCEGVADGTTDESARQSQRVIERILGGSLSIQALEARVVEAAGEVTALSAQPAIAPTPPPDATILVVQADGTGGPMVQPSPAASPVRLGQGQKRGKKKEAVVTGLDTSAPSRRTPQEVVAALLPAPASPQAAARPGPVAKARRATLSGKTVALRPLVARVARREGPHIPPRGARTAGAAALPQQRVRPLPPHPLGLAMIHATASLGDTAHARLGETPPPRTAWVRHDLESLMAGQSAAVSTALTAAANDPRGTAPQWQAIRRTASYDRRNRPYRRDDEYVAQGWPIGTGGIEGACRPLVQDRLEQAGRRWTKAGAQAGLDLRALRLTEHGDRDWQLHRQQPHHRL
jgi:hypothetical protein